MNGARPSASRATGVGSVERLGNARAQALDGLHQRIRIITEVSCTRSDLGQGTTIIIIIIIIIILIIISMTLLLFFLIFLLFFIY